MLVNKESLYLLQAQSTNNRASGSTDLMSTGMQGMQIDLLPQEPTGTNQSAQTKTTDNGGSMAHGMVVTCWTLHAGKHCGVQCKQTLDPWHNTSLD
jgi:hypothetical protein